MRRLTAIAVAVASGLTAIAWTIPPADALVLDPNPPSLRAAVTCTAEGFVTVQADAAGLDEVPGWGSANVRVGWVDGAGGFGTVMSGEAAPDQTYHDSAVVQPIDAGLKTLAVQGLRTATTSGVDWVTRATTDVQVACPSVRVSPGTLAQRTGPVRLQVGASGFYATSGPVTFTLESGLTVSAPVDTTGRAFGEFALPGLPDCGSHVTTAVQAPPPVIGFRRPIALGDTLTARTTLVVTCPYLTATPDVVASTELPRLTHVTGSGWDPGTDVALSTDGASGPIARVAADGTIAADVALVPRPCGLLPLRGAELRPTVSRLTRALLNAVSDWPVATTSVTVTCPTPETSATPTAPAPPATPATTPVPGPPTAPPGASTAPPTAPAPPTLTVDPVLPSGGVGVAHGAGFRPGQLVTLTWVLPDGSTAPGTTTAVIDSAGHLSASCLVLAHARLGPRRLTAGAVAGHVLAQASTLVVNGPMEPGRSRLLGRR